MRILVAVSHYLPCASPTAREASALCEALAARGHDVAVLTRRFQEDLPPEEHRRGVIVVRERRSWPTSGSSYRRRASAMAAAADHVLVVGASDARVAGALARACAPPGRRLWLIRASGEDPVVDARLRARASGTFSVGSAGRVTSPEVDEVEQALRADGPATGAPAADDDLARFMRLHVGEIPPFRALIRAVESCLVSRHAAGVRHVVDLGCGDGIFGALTLPTPMALGVDPAEEDLARARRGGMYDRLSRAPADQLPLEDHTCDLVLANSVLEHIPGLDAVLVEVRRVLTADGRLLVTAPSDRFADGLGVARVLDRLGFATPARWYRAWFNGISRHVHLDDAAAWRLRLARAGFIVTHEEYYLSHGAMFWFDLLHYVSVPCLLSRRLLGRWHWTGRPLLARAWTAWLLGLARRPPDPHGPCLFIVARPGPPA